jgi:hypothetical protein
MASTGNTKHERALLEGLRRAVHGLRAPFSRGGTLVPEQPVTLCFPDKTQIPVLSHPAGRGCQAGDLETVIACVLHPGRWLLLVVVSLAKIALHWNKRGIEAVILVR